MSRRSRSALVSVNLDEFSDDDIREEAIERNMIVLAKEDDELDRMTRVERLYYESRGPDPMSPDLQSRVRELLADLYGRAA